MKKYFFLLIILLFFTSNLYSQIEQEATDDFSHFIKTGGELSDSFFSFDNSTQIKTAATLLLIGSAYSLDYNSRTLAQKNFSNFNNKFFYIDKIYGSEYTLIGIAGLYGYGIIFNDPEIRKVGLQVIEATAYSGLITSIIKSVIGRSRPYTNANKFTFHPINFNVAQTAFPSGHSTVAFAVSTVLANNTNSLFLKIIYFTAAGLVAGARIYHNAHWLSDSITGSAIGYLVGDFVSSIDDPNEKTSQSKINFLPYFSNQSLGVVLTF